MVINQEHRDGGEGWEFSARALGYPLSSSVEEFQGHGDLPRQFSKGHRRRNSRSTLLLLGLLPDIDLGF